VIRAEKLPNALFALNGVLVLARAMAYEERPGSELADVLDAAEYLPRLLAMRGDQTEHFREVVATLASKDSKFQMVVDPFDQAAPPGWDEEQT
jgi:hypothetical protein